MKSAGSLGIPRVRTSKCAPSSIGEAKVLDFLLHSSRVNPPVQLTMDNVGTFWEFLQQLFNVLIANWNSCGYFPSVFGQNLFQLVASALCCKQISLSNAWIHHKLLLQALARAEATALGFVQTNGSKSLAQNCRVSGFFGRRKKQFAVHPTRFP